MMIMQTLRRQPQQQRSRDRVELILDTAAYLLMEGGAAAATITAVAERSGLAPGSIYEWVTGERELIGAVAERGLDSIHAGLVEMIGHPASELEATQRLSAGMQYFFRRYHQDVGLRQALAFMDSDPSLSQINLADTRRNADTIAAALAPIFPGIDLGPRILLLTHLCGAVAILTANVAPSESAVLLGEFEQMAARALTFED